MAHLLVQFPGRFVPDRHRHLVPQAPVGLTVTHPSEVAPDVAHILVQIPGRFAL